MCLTGRSLEEAKAVEKRMEEVGRDVVDMNSNVVRLLEVAQGRLIY